MFPAFDLPAVDFVSILFINVLRASRTMRSRAVTRGGVAEWLKALVC